jgi:hypothetical protein
MAHVLEMGGRQKEGLTFMSSTENDWNVSLFFRYDYRYFLFYESLVIIYL